LNGGTSRMTGNMVSEITVNFISGTGKFRKIQGGIGSGEVEWIATFQDRELIKIHPKVQTCRKFLKLVTI
jgi:hypothetical protein